MMPPEPSTELNAFGGLVIYSLSEKMLAPGKDTGCPLGFVSGKGHFLKTLKRIASLLPLSPRILRGGGADKSIGERSVYRGEHIYFIHVVLNLLLKR